MPASLAHQGSHGSHHWAPGSLRDLRIRVRTTGDAILRLIGVEAFDLTASEFPAASSIFLSRLFKRPLARALVPHADLAALHTIQKDGVPVYVLSYRSSLDVLLLSMRLAAEGMPAIHLAAGLDALHLQPLGKALRIIAGRVAFWLTRTRVPHPIDDGFLKQAILRREAVVLFLREKKRHPRRFAGHERHLNDPLQDHPIQEYLSYLLGLQTHLEFPLYLVPHLPLWENGPVFLKKTLSDWVWGARLSPGLARRAWQVLRHRGKGRLFFHAPINLREFSANFPEANRRQQVKALRWQLNQKFEEVQSVARGPKLLPREHLIRSILQDPGVKAASEKVDRKKSRGTGAVLAFRYLNEMAGDYRRWTIEFFEKVVNYFLRHNISGLVYDEQVLESVARAMAKGPVVLLPNHRSHLDYFLISYVLYRNRMATPYICAGDNLNFWPAGPFFRRSGAYFIQRSFEETTLYPVVLRRYLKSLMNARILQEVFLEGGRTRTGKMRPPMLGILSLMTKAYFAGDCKELYFVPVSLSYDRVPEEKAYVREMGGLTKRPEGLRDLWKAWRIRRTNLGRVYMNFGEPISSAVFFRDKGITPDTQEHTKRRASTELALEASRRVQQGIVLTATSLLAMILLSRTASQGYEISRRDAADKIDDLLRLLGSSSQAKHLRSFTLLDGLEEGLDRAIELYKENGVLARGLVSDRLRVRMDDPEVPFLLDYYRNGCLHCFLNHALLASVVLANPVGIAESELLAQCTRLSALLEGDFPVGSPLTLVEALEDLTERGILQRDHQKVVSSVSPAALMPIHAAISGLLVAHYETARVVSRWMRGEIAWQVDVKEEKLIAHVLAGMSPGVEPEARSRFHGGNALQHLADQKWITLKPERQGKVFFRKVLLHENIQLQEVETHLAFLGKLCQVRREHENRLASDSF